VGAEFALQSLGVRSAYLLRDTSNTYTVGLAGYFKDAFVRGGGVIVLEDSYRSGAANFSDQINRLKSLKTAPQILYISALPDDIVALVAQLRASGVLTPIIGGDGYDTPALQALGKPANAVYYTTHILLDPVNGNSRAKAFIKKYRALYGKAPENAFAALGYDSVRLLVNAMIRAGSTDKNKLVASLAATRNYVGVTGAVTFSKTVHIPKKAVTVIEVSGGKLNLTGEFTASYVPKP